MSRDEGSSEGPDSNPEDGAPDYPSDLPLREGALRPSGPPRLELRVDHRQRSVLVQLDGELDILTAPKLDACIDELIRGSDGDLTLDLRAVRFIDSAGLQLLLHTRRRLGRGSRKLSVICVDGPVLRLLQLTRLTGTLGVTTL